MSDDLKARLRKHVEQRGGSNLNGAWQMMTDAANALDVRDAEIARLRGVLERIARTSEGGASDQHAPDMWEACRTWACDALNGGDNEG